MRDSVFNEAILEGLIARVDLVYHLAAVVGVEHYVGDPYQVLNVNVNGTQNVLKLGLQARQARRLLVDLGSLRPQSQDPVERGRRPSARLHSHRSLVLFDLEGGRRALLLRVCEDGAQDHGRSVFQRVRPAARRHRRGPRDHDLPRAGAARRARDGDRRRQPQTRCFTYVSDAIAATVQAGLREEAEARIFNIGNAPEYSIRSLGGAADRDQWLQWIDPTRASAGGVRAELQRIRDKFPDVERIHRILDVKAEVTLDEGLRHTIDYSGTRRPPLRWKRSALKVDVDTYRLLKGSPHADLPGAQGVAASSEWPWARTIFGQGDPPRLHPAWICSTIC